MLLEVQVNATNHNRQNNLPILYSIKYTDTLFFYQDQLFPLVPGAHIARMQVAVREQMW